MADSACSLEVVAVNHSRRRKTIRYKATFSAGDYPATGFVLELSAATNPKGLAGAFPGCPPDEYSVSGTLDGNGAKVHLDDTGIDESVLQVFDAADSELAGALDAGIVAEADFFIELSGPVGKF